MTKIFYRSFALALALSSTSIAEAAPPLMPLLINDSNSSVHFTVDSTWHEVHGQTKGLSGRLELARPADYESLHGEITLPVKTFDTDNSKRDDKLRDVMAEPEHPLVKFSLQSLELGCDKALEQVQGVCPLTAKGELNIRGVSRPWELKGELRQQEEKTEITAKGNLNWKDFGVEDPSIPVIAKLAEEVEVSVHLKCAGEKSENIEKETAPEKDVGK